MLEDLSHSERSEQTLPWLPIDSTGEATVLEMVGTEQSYPSASSMLSYWIASHVKKLHDIEQLAASGVQQTVNDTHSDEPSNRKPVYPRCAAWPMDSSKNLL